MNNEPHKILIRNTDYKTTTSIYKTPTIQLEIIADHSETEYYKCGSHQLKITCQLGQNELKHLLEQLNIQATIEPPKTQNPNLKNP